MLDISRQTEETNPVSRAGGGCSFPPVLHANFRVCDTNSTKSNRFKFGLQWEVSTAGGYIDVKS